MISPSMKVREVALDLPQATRVLESLKIDYCCGGDQPLGEACAAAGVELQSLERLLNETRPEEVQGGGPLDFQRASLSELIDYILDKHHVYTRDEMERLAPLFEKVITAHGQNHPELAQMNELFAQLCADLRPHMFKEEQVLFPFIVQLERSVLENRAAPFAPFGTVINPIRMMMSEHDTAGDLLRAMGALSSDYTFPADGCPSYQALYQGLEAFEQDLHQHIHLENNVLFPRAIEMEAKANE
jgi:regulator of cell morphogenesis and NO signaling